MSTERDLIRKHRRNGILLDTNVLLLWIVGQSGKRAEQFERTRKFTSEDYRRLKDLIAPFDCVFTTPHVLTEVSNLAQLGRGKATEFLALYPLRRASTGGSSSRTGDPGDGRLKWLGLTDVGIAKAAEQPMLVVTDDVGLYTALSRQGADVIKFTTSLG